MPVVAINIGPDPNVGGVSYLASIRDASGEWDYLDDGGWNGTGPRRSSTDAWYALARRHIGLPAIVKAAGLRWDDATVRPFGWSQGAGHAPNGITIQWSWRA